MHQKWLILGPGGAGKSTLAQRLAACLDIPVIHLDRYYWQAGWVKPTAQQWQAQVAQLLSTEAWIMDGNFGGSLAQRLAAADAVVVLDIAPWRCLWRLVLRRWHYRQQARPSMQAACVEQLDLAFLWWVLSYRTRRLPALLSQLAAAQQQRTLQLFVIRTDAQLEAFLATCHRNNCSNDTVNTAGS